MKRRKTPTRTVRLMRDGEIVVVEVIRETDEILIVRLPGGRRVVHRIARHSE